MLIKFVFTRIIPTQLRLQDFMIVLVVFTNLREVFIQITSLNVNASSMVSIAFVTTASAKEALPISICLIEITALWTNLTGVIRHDFNEVEAFPVKGLHQLLLCFTSRKTGEHTINPSTFVELTNVEQLQDGNGFLVQR